MQPSPEFSGSDRVVSTDLQTNHSYLGTDEVPHLSMLREKWKMLSLRTL